MSKTLLRKLGRTHKFMFTNLLAMNFFRPISLGCLFFCLAAGHKTPKNQDAWTLVWADEFNYTGLPDSTKWNYDVGGQGWGNNELEYYTNKRSQNVRVENGNLVIELKKEKWENKNYTSTRLITKGKGDWKYGK